MQTVLCNATTFNRRHRLTCLTRLTLCCWALLHWTPKGENRLSIGRHQFSQIRNHLNRRNPNWWLVQTFTLRKIHRREAPSTLESAKTRLSWRATWSTPRNTNTRHLMWLIMHLHSHQLQGINIRKHSYAQAWESWIALTKISLCSKKIIIREAAPR